MDSFFTTPASDSIKNKVNADARIFITGVRMSSQQWSILQDVLADLKSGGVGVEMEYCVIGGDE